MTPTETNTQRTGFAYGLAAFLFWGFAPFYFKAVDHIPALELLAHRIVWAIPLLAVMLWLQRAWRRIDKRTLGMLLVSAALIGINWLCYIIAINTDRVIEAALGYYMNPLVSMVLGLVFLGERMRPFQWAAVVLAATGTVWMAFSAGGVPWLALILAFSFGLYGLVRKTVRVESLQGLFIETLVLAPLAYGYVIWLEATGPGAMNEFGLGSDLLLVAAGVVTTLPLYWFTQGARRLPLTTIGFLQYLAPTIQFLLAVFAFGEPFDHARLVAFACIWSAVALYMGGAFWVNRRVVRRV